ncbi:YobA family protein [Bacillus sp. REN16]|uniref:YobA family protein n=1 Tax=Bacillus sp. REN16 TaxID=2887296 RepID=UPI001E6223D7|nr:YobA family protein [Bacillus sp. REN16]MCC3359300.1 YobA family protein [Bacillus sp. REN16]
MKQIAILIILLLVGCGTSDQNADEMTITGYILEVGERILVNEKITGEEFVTKTEQEIHDEYYYSSTFFSVDSIDQYVVSKLEVGQKVRIVVDGVIAESAPAQAKASKIEVVEE